MLFRTRSPYLADLEDVIKDLFGTVYPDRNFKVNKTDNGYTLLVKAPGFKKDEVKLSIDKSVLTITGKHTDKDTWLEDFERSIELPNDIDTGNIAAEMNEGILKITLPTKEAAKPQAITIK